MASAADCCCVLWGHRSTRREPDHGGSYSVNSFPVWTAQKDSKNQKVVSSLFVHMKQKFLELKLPVVLSAGAGSLLRPSAPQEDALCSERSAENLWQHQRAACCFSNLTFNEKRASCMSMITTASLGDEPTHKWKRCLSSVSTEEWRSPEMQSVSNEWLGSNLQRFSPDFWSCEATIMSCCYCKKRILRYHKRVQRLHATPQMLTEASPDWGWGEPACAAQVFPNCFNCFEKQRKGLS